jgi:hypothetical protein
VKAEREIAAVRSSVGRIKAEVDRHMQATDEAACCEPSACAQINRLSPSSCVFCHRLGYEGWPHPLALDRQHCDPLCCQLWCCERTRRARVNSSRHPRPQVTAASPNHQVDHPQQPALRSPSGDGSIRSCARTLCISCCCPDPGHPGALSRCVSGIGWRTEGGVGRKSVTAWLLVRR